MGITLVSGEGLRVLTGCRRGPGRHGYRVSPRGPARVLGNQSHRRRRTALPSAARPFDVDVTVKRECRRRWDTPTLSTG